MSATATATTTTPTTTTSTTRLPSSQKDLSMSNREAIKLSTTGATTKLAQHEIIPAKRDVGALANRINLETRSLHDKVDKMVSLKMAIALRNYKVYRQGLQAFYHIFASIEKAMEYQLQQDTQWSDMLKQVWKPEVARTAKAEQDLLFFYDDKKEKFVNPKMSQQIKFANHILEVTKAKPYLLFAYLHVMYLALFAGGRLMRSSFAKATGFYPKKDGLKHEDIMKMGFNFFNFDVTDESLLRVIYKRDYELVTRGGLTEEQKLEVIEESKYIFKQNAECLSELEAYNMEKIHGTWTYMVLTKGYIALYAIAAILVLLYLQRVPQIPSLMSTTTKSAHDTAVNSFNLNHSSYHQYRPSFTPILVNPFLVDLGLATYNKQDNTYTFDNDKRIVEIACGTGKFTKNLIDNGWIDNLSVVDPSRGMLESFKSNFPTVQNVIQASSYDTPFDDDSIDAVIVAQGFHWFADEESLKEISRILKPGGKLGLIWNFDYTSQSQDSIVGDSKYYNAGTRYYDALDFSATSSSNNQELLAQYFANQKWNNEVTKYVYGFDVKVPQYRHGKWRAILLNNPYFQNKILDSFALYDKVIDKDDVWKYWATRSYITELSKDRQTEIKTHIEEIIANSTDDASFDKETHHLIKPMGTHTVVVGVNK
ncbi:hypothetical protein KGF57_000410 [Candida theae]|uniref:Methyltransferase type 11 domain-containing protein n=1 Tax=Candida theae TaxID=1198502 RepID=A0AAD5G0Q7_9ASCO|nr:uncharacterized protein KGF57_000410 [Candida theae]KAI5967382.1 hypothetical protein KGF57_000410 [Candida theae]